jgi:hypothetical protein
MTRSRLSRAALLAHCYDIVNDHLEDKIEMSARNVYYKLVGLGLIDQDGEGERKNYRRVVETIAKGKEAGDFPLHWLQDNLRIPSDGEIAGGMSSVDDALDQVVEYLEWLPDNLIDLDHWYGQPRVPFVMVEKDTLEGTVRKPCKDHHAPLYISRGYSSWTGLYAWTKSLNKALRRADWVFQPEILYLGDHDPEGMNIPEAILKVVNRIAELKRWAIPWLSIRRIALTKDQAIAGGYPPMEVKLKSSRARGYIDQYGDQSWEIEAMDARRLRVLLDDALKDLWDPDIAAIHAPTLEVRRNELRRRMRDEAEDLMFRAFGDLDDNS